MGYFLTFLHYSGKKQHDKEKDLPHPFMDVSEIQGRYYIISSIADDKYLKPETYAYS